MSQATPDNALPSPETSDAGFTLVELLVSLALLALMGVLLATAISGARGGLLSIERQASESAVHAARLHIRRVISEARPLRRPGSAVDASIIEGTPTSMSFVSSYAPAGQWSGLYVVTLALEPNAQTGRFDLVELRTPYRPDTGGAEPARPTTRHKLVTDLGGVAFRYFGVPTGQEVPGWTDSWADLEKIPDLVTLEAAFPRPDRRVWTAMTVAIPSK